MNFLAVSVTVAFSCLGSAAGYEHVMSVAAHAAAAEAAAREFVLEWPTLVYGTFMLSIAALIITVFWDRGAKTFIPILIYIGALSTMTVFLRSLFANHGFNYPRFTTSCHFLGTALVAGCVLLYKHMQGEKVTILNQATFVKGVGPAAACFASSLGFCNLGIAYTNAHFYEMVDSSTPVMAAGVAFLLAKPVPSQLWWPLLLCCVGLSMCWSGELHFNLVGLIFLLVGSLARATKTMLNQIIMSTDNENMQSLQPVELTFYNAVTCLCLMLPWALVSEGLAPFSAILSLTTFFSVMVTVFNACIINLSGSFVIKEIGGVAANLTGTLKGSISMIGAWATLGEVITGRQVFGYGLAIAGITWYNRMDKEIKDAKSKGEPLDKTISEKQPLCQSKV